MSYNNNNGGYKKKSGGMDLSKYETVKSRKVRLKTDHPESFILPFPMSDINYATNYILMGALIWKDKATFTKIDPSVLLAIQTMGATATSQNAGMVLASIAILAQADGAGFSLSMAGGKGADQNAWVENAEESAVGRALDNMGYHSGSASQDEMKKVQHMQEAQQARVQLENQIESLYGQLLNQGQNPNYLSQVVSQTVKAFQQLQELSPDELERLLAALQAVGQPSTPTQPAQAQPQPMYQAQAPTAYAPGSPAPVGR